MFPSAFLRAIGGVLRLGLRQLHLRLTGGGAVLPVVAVPQARELAICQGHVYVALMLVVSGAYFVALCTAERVSMVFAPVALIVVVHIVYLGIYALEHYGLIDGERCDWLIKNVESLCPVGNFFLPTPPTMVLPRRVLTILARCVVRAIAPPEEEEDESSL